MTHPLPAPAAPFASRRRLARLAPLVVLAALGLVGCSPLAAEGPGRPLPSYDGHSTELFDDVIEPLAVGISLDTRPDPRADKLLRERTQVGDATLRVRVTTVTAKEEDNGTRYLLGLKSLDPLAGHFPPGETFEVTVPPTGSSTGILKRLQGVIIGRSFVGFVRAFVRPDGDQELHFHLAPDSKEELAAVRDAAVMAQLQSR